MFFRDAVARAPLQDLLVQLPALLRSIGLRHELLQDKLCEWIDRSEKTTEYLLLGVETIDQFFTFEVYLSECVHLELERLVSDHGVLLKHVL